MLICGGCNAQVHGHHDNAIRMGEETLFVVCPNCKYRISVKDDVAVILYDSMKNVLGGIVDEMVDRRLAEIKTEDEGG